jgi:hypothetical protein
MQGTYRSFKEADPTHPVTNGVGTGFSEHFNAPAVSRSSDYMSVHSYPYFHRTNRLDPPIGQRTTYSVNYMIAWAAMQGRPVLVQETGATEERTTTEDVVRYLRVTAMSAWADGAAGYFWWNSHDIDRAFRLPKEGVYLNHSVKGSTGDLGPWESRMGLLDGANQAKAAGREFARCAKWIEALGLGWKDERPAVYVVAPASPDFTRTMIDLITPFVLAKQAHLRPRLMRDGDPVPADAAAVVVPGFALSAAGKQAVGAYLEAGGTVYQSWEKDFAETIRLTGQETSPTPTRVWLSGRLGSLASEQELRVPEMPVRGVERAPNADELALLVTGREDPLEYTFGRPLYVRAAVGRGHYYYFAGRLEPALARQYDPWERDQSANVYAAFVADGEVRLDDPSVELFHKTRGEQEIVGLISHSPRARDVALRLRRSARLVDYFTGAEAGTAESFELHLGPADVRVLRVERRAGR